MPMARCAGGSGAGLLGVLAVVACTSDAPGRDVGPGDGGALGADASASPPVEGRAGIKVSPPTSTTTSEAGGVASFAVVLSSKPTAAVVVTLGSSNPKEGAPDRSALTFTEATWDAPQLVTVKGQDDPDADGDQPYTITFGAVQSADARYAALDPDDVALTNTDDDVAGLVVSQPSPAGTVSEAGGSATFTVHLRARPLGDVRVPLAVSRPLEAKVEPAELVFTASDYDTPKTVVVTGKDDAVADGDQAFTLAIGATASTHQAYAGLSSPALAFVNQDDDIPGFIVGAATPSTHTSEAGGQVTLTVRLRSKPTADVTIPVSTTKPSEAATNLTELTFTPDSYATPQTITITGAGDSVDDGDQAYALVLGAAASADPKYDGLDAPDVALTNDDDDTAGVTVSAPAPGSATTEAGGQVTFTVALTSEPTASVTIPVSSSDAAEGTLDTTSLTFTAANWSVPRTVTVTGAQDHVDDGDRAYAVILGAATSADALYHAMNPADVALTNADDDAAGISVGAASPGTLTTEGGAAVSVSVVLLSEPTGDVTIPLGVSKAGEATLSASSLTFTAGNWNVAQTVTVTGQDDAVDDGDQGYALVLGAVASADAKYGGMNPADVALTNADDDAAGVAVSAPSPSNRTTEAGGQVTFTVALTSEPTASVTIPISSSDTAEGVVDKVSLTFSGANWDVPQTVTVTGVDDRTLDGDQTYGAVLGTATSADPAYHALDPADVSLVNTRACSSLLFAGGGGISVTGGVPAEIAGYNVAKHVEAWVNPSSSGVLGIINIGRGSSCGNPSCGGEHFTLDVVSGFLSLDVGQGVGTTSLSVPTGVWTFIFAGFDPASGYYAGKVLANHQVVTVPVAIGNGITTSSLSAGTTSVIGTDQNARHFLGGIDVVRVWSRVPSTAEIDSRHRSRLVAASENGLVRQWWTEEGAGATTSDDVSTQSSPLAAASWQAACPP